MNPREEGTKEQELDKIQSINLDTLCRTEYPLWSLVCDQQSRVVVLDTRIGLIVVFLPNQQVQVVDFRFLDFSSVVDDNYTNKVSGLIIVYCQLLFT